MILLLKLRVLTNKMIPLRTSFESTPTLRSSRHSLSNFSGVSLLSMLENYKKRNSSHQSANTNASLFIGTLQVVFKTFHDWNLPSHFSEDCIVFPFVFGGVDISSSASRRYPSLNVRTWGFPQELAVTNNLIIREKIFLPNSDLAEHILVQQL